MTKTNYRSLGYTGRMRVRLDTVHLVGKELQKGVHYADDFILVFGNCKPTLQNNLSKFKLIERHKDSYHTIITKLLKDCTVEEVIEKQGGIEYIVFYYKPKGAIKNMYEVVKQKAFNEETKTTYPVKVISPQFKTKQEVGRWVVRSMENKNKNYAYWIREAQIN